VDGASRRFRTAAFVMPMMIGLMQIAGSMDEPAQPR
jgi:hypothetical protein